MTNTNNGCACTPNQSIKCTVTNCAHHCQDQNYCGLNAITVGTGVIFRADGYILTNYHVLAGGRDCTVAMDTGRTYEAQYVAGDERNDLAVLKVELTGLPAATFGDSDQLVVGDKVYAIGNPLGVELRGTLTDGIVSAINRDVQVDGRTSP